MDLMVKLFRQFQGQEYALNLIQYHHNLFWYERIGQYKLKAVLERVYERHIATSAGT